ncbi:MAG: DUF6088 family protein [Lactimicrobium sp.]|jgi:predicted transcriptional regulator of viral defense system|uniref:DUF6088 family protein n=1 Tax=Lactimicrobium sp. TaxID=2563780 RepID=UPI002F3516FA
MDALLNYLETTFKPNEPIIESDLQYSGMSKNMIRQHLKRLTDEKEISRYDNGVYYIPKTSILNFKVVPPIHEVIKKKYLIEGTNTIGYLSGLDFANMIHLTTQVPNEPEVVTNKASRIVRETKIRGYYVLLRKPRTIINDDNYRVLQFLDLMNEIDKISELEGSDMQKAIKDYMQIAGISFTDLEKYLFLYPDRIYKNMFIAGVLYGISPQ